MKSFTIFMFILFLSGCSTFQKVSSVDGQIINAHNFSVKDPNTNYTGAIVGGGVGGLLGNQIGKGNGRTVATVAGTGLGALIGHNIDNSPTDMVELTVKDNLGNVQTVVQRTFGKKFYVNQRVQVNTYANGRKQVVDF